MSWCFLRRLLLPLAVVLTNAPIAAAQDKPLLRVEISTSGRAVYDSLLSALAARAGLTGQLAVSSAAPLQTLRDFCRNDPNSSPQVVMTARHLQGALASECANNGLDDIAMVELAHDALILAVRRGSALTGLTSRQVYLAIAREVPIRDDFVRNTAVRWSDVEPTLPPQDIRFQLPMRDEGSRATFDSLVLEGGCRDEPPVKQIFAAQARTARCTTTRSDRVREIPRPQALRNLLEAPIGTVGVLTQSQVAASNGQLVGLALDGMSPTPDAIQAGSYDFINSLWLIAKRARGATDPVGVALERITAEAQSDAITGPDGPLPGLGLVPLTVDEREAQRFALAAEMAPYSLATVTSWVASTTADAWQMFGPRTTQPGMTAADLRMTFTSLMDLAGYKIASIQSSIGIIPDASMTFALAREMSDADHEYLARVLHRDALVRPGAIAATQRRIIRSIMGVQEVGGFEVSKVEIDFLPLPKIALEVTPKDASPSDHQPERSSGDSE